MVLITDALQAMGMGDSSYQFGGHKVTVSQGVATLEDGALASSTITMNAALAKTVQVGIPLKDAIRMATETPASVLGMPRKGRIAPGMDVDLVLMDNRFEGYMDNGGWRNCISPCEGIISLYARGGINQKWIQEDPRAERGR